MAQEAETKFSLESKELMEQELSEHFKTFSNFIVTNYFGLSANEISELRKNLHKLSSKYCVIKNKMGKKVLDNLGIKETGSFIDGGVGIGFIGGDVIEASKSMVNFSKKYKPFKIKGAYIDGKSLDVERIKELALLPSREHLLAMIATAMQSPISGFVNVLNGVIKKFVYAINAIKKKKEETK